MNVIYSLSTAPFFAKNPDGEFAIDRFELCTAAISSLIRRRAGDNSVMHTDSRGAEYLGRIGLSGLWNEVAVTLPGDLDGINPLMFWAAGKLFALKAAACPLIMLDTDFIAWNLPALSDSIVAAHREDITPNVYPDISKFDMKNYTFNRELNYTARPLNTAFLYMPDDEFKQYYIDCSMEFMKSAKPCGDYLTYMVYAEQRLLAMLAEYKNVKTDTLLDFEKLHIPQKNYTHLWGAKQIMRNNPGENERFLEKCRLRFRKDFPEWEWIADLS
jgi:hypothetical protein